MYKHDRDVLTTLESQRRKIRKTNSRVLIFHLATFSFFAVSENFCNPPIPRENNITIRVIVIFCLSEHVLLLNQQPSEEKQPRHLVWCRTLLQNDKHRVSVQSGICCWCTSGTQLFAALQYVICPFVKCGRNAAR